MPLAPDEVLEVKALIEAADERLAKAQHDRVMRHTAIGGLLTAVIVALLGWGLSSAFSAVGTQALTAAQAEGRRVVETYLSSAPLITSFTSRLGQAEDSLLRASGIADSARRDAADADDAIQEIRKKLATTNSVLQSMSDVSKFADEVAKNPKFQEEAIKHLPDLGQLQRKIDDLQTAMQLRFPARFIDFVVYSDYDTNPALDKTGVQIGAGEGGRTNKIKLIPASDGICFMSLSGDFFLPNGGNQHVVTVEGSNWVASVMRGPGGFTGARCWRY
jgi:hypothetical protein